MMRLSARHIARLEGFLIVSQGGVRPSRYGRARCCLRCPRGQACMLENHRALGSHVLGEADPSGGNAGRAF